MMMLAKNKNVKIAFLESVPIHATDFNKTELDKYIEDCTVVSLSHCGDTFEVFKVFLRFDPVTQF